MKLIRTALAALCFVGVATLPSVSSAGETQNYTLVDLGTLGGTESFTGSISDSKWIVGLGRLPGDRDSREFVYRGGKIVGVTPLNSGNLRAGISAINNRGQIASGMNVGSYYYPAIYDLKSNRTTILGSLGGITNYGFTGTALGINNRGQAVGYSYLPDGNRHAFLWDSGRLFDLGSFGSYSAATAINNSGTIVGFSADKSGIAQAFVIEAGIMIPIDPFASGDSIARDINEHNQVVGEGLTNDRTAFHGFLWQRGVVIDLGAVPDGRNSYPSAINNRGQVVGLADVPIGIETYTDPDTGEIIRRVIYGWTAFLYERGEMMQLNKLVQRPDWDLTWATDVNNSGDIVGYGVVGGKYRAFLLTQNGK